MALPPSSPPKPIMFCCLWLKEQHKPTSSETVQHFKFHSQFWNPGESVATFVAELRSIVEFCNFGTSLEALLQDQVSVSAIQCHLRQKCPFHSTKLRSSHKEWETAACNVKELQGGISTTLSKKVHKVTPQFKAKPGKATPHPRGSQSDHTCYRCGKP